MLCYVMLLFNAGQVTPARYTEEHHGALG